MSANRGQKNRDSQFIPGLNPLGPSRRVKAAIRKAAKSVGCPQPDEAAKLIHHLSLLSGVPGSGIRLVCPETAAYERVLVLFRPQKVLCAGPVLPEIHALYSSSGAAVTIRTPDDALAGREMVDFSLADKFDLLHLSTPNRVTGLRISPDLLSAIAEKVSALLVIDCSLDGFAQSSALPPSLVHSGRAVVIGSSGLFYGLGGARLSAVYADADSARRLGLEGYAPQLIETAAARSALKDRMFLDAASRFISEETRNLRKAASGVDGVELLSGDTPLVTFRCRDSLLIRSELKADGIAFLKGEDVGLGNEFTVCSLDSHAYNVRVFKALKRLRKQ